MRGEIGWFALAGSIDVTRVLHDLDQRGLSYRQPGSPSDAVQIVTADGLHECASVAEVVALFGTPHPPPVLLWLDRDTNVGFWPGEGTYGLRFDLNGLNWSAAQRVVFAVIGCALGITGTIGVVVDRQLEDRHGEWIRWFDGEGAMPYPADLLLVANEDGRGHTITVSDESWLTHAPDRA